MFAPFSVPFHVGWWRKTATCSFLLQIYLQWDSPFLMLSQILAVLYWYQPMFLWRFRILFRWPPNISHTAHKSLSRVRITFRAEHFPTVLLANVPFQSAAVCRFLKQNHCWHQPVCSSELPDVSDTKVSGAAGWRRTTYLVSKHTQPYVKVQLDDGTWRYLETYHKVQVDHGDNHLEEELHKSQGLEGCCSHREGLWTVISSSLFWGGHLVVALLL